MVAAIYIPAIRETIKQNEIGNATPYALSYARLDKSGASFGVMQGDTNVSLLARDTLEKVLTAASAPPAAMARIMAALSQPLPGGDPLSAADAKLANAALASPKGRALVDAMDAQLLAVVLEGVDGCIAAAGQRKVGFAPRALLYTAPWINMTGPPALLKAWLAGSPVFGLAPPPPPQVGPEAMESYLQATAYFRQHPKNFLHYRQCVEIGAKLLPA